MPRYLKPTSFVLASALTYLPLPCGLAQAQLDPEDPRAAAALPEPPRVDPPAVVEVGGDEPHFTTVTIGFQSCRLPCRMYVPPGLQPVIASGRASLVSHVDVPRAAVRIDLVDITGRYRVAGAILIPVGIVTASSLWAIGLGCLRTPGCEVANYILWPVLGVASMFTGIGLLGYAAGRDRYGVRVTLATPAPTGPRLTGIAAAPTADGAAMAASFAF